MPLTKDFSHRQEILDTCLRNTLRRWDADALLEELNRQLAERWDKKVSRRTLFDDLRYLQEQSGAPVEKYKDGARVFYRYSEPGFSLKSLPLGSEDVARLQDAVILLRGVGVFSILQEVEEIIATLEHAAADKPAPYILFENHTVAVGTHHLDDLLQAIKGHTVLTVQYQPFGSEKSHEWTLHPYLLKQHRARWFLIGRRDDATVVSVLALDRIRSLKPTSLAFIENNLFDPHAFYEHLIGVSIPEGETVQEVSIRVRGKQCHYIRTKPIHHSQQIVEESGEDGGYITLALRVINNYELRSNLMSYGPDIEVVAPAVLRGQMATLYQNGCSNYREA